MEDEQLIPKNSFKTLRMLTLAVPEQRELPLLSLCQDTWFFELPLLLGELSLGAVTLTLHRLAQADSGCERSMCRDRGGGG